MRAGDRGALPLDLEGREVEGPEALPLHLVVIDPGAGSRHQLGHRGGEIRPLAGVGLDDRRLAVLARHEEVARERQRRPPLLPRGEEEQVDRPGHRAPGDVDEGAVAQEGGVERHERMAVEFREAAEPGLHLAGIARQDLGEAGHDRPLGELAHEGMPGGEAAVHEHQPGGGVEGVRREAPRSHGVRVSVRPLEGTLRDRSHVEQPPILLPEGGEAQLREAADRLPAHRRQPGGIAGALAGQPLEFGRVALDSLNRGARDGALPSRGHGHGLRPPPAARPAPAPPRARSTPSPPAPGPAPCRPSGRCGRPPARARGPARCS